MEPLLSLLGPSMAASQLVPITGSTCVLVCQNLDLPLAMGTKMFGVDQNPDTMAHNFLNIAVYMLMTVLSFLTTLST